MFENEKSLQQFSSGDFKGQDMTTDMSCAMVQSENRGERDHKAGC